MDEREEREGGVKRLRRDQEQRQSCSKVGKSQSERKYSFYLILLTILE